MSNPTSSEHRAGFVTIVGHPNVGKSTLMNALVGEKLSIVTSKAQTTRHRVMGIVNGEDYQIIYSDTPGIIEPKYKLQESMMGYVKSALHDTDIVLYVTDSIERRALSQELLKRLNSMEAPLLIAINKIDLSNQESLEELVEYWRGLLPNGEIFPISATEKFNLHSLFNRILELLPKNPPWYDKESLTDRTLRFFASEIIREKIFIQYRKEIPYSTEVVIEEFKEEPEINRISAIIYVARESQKGIIIGKGGEALKRVATMARLEMETFFDKKLFLQIFVKVSPKWREDSAKLKDFGYIQE
ncbi:MAG: GTPase Era [Bacteroidales bacterium]